MKAYRRWLCLIVISSIFMGTSCTTLLFKGIDDALNTWIGAPEDELYISWGPPTAVQQLNNDRKVVVYADAYNQIIGGYYIGDTWIPPVDSRLSCKIIFVIEKGYIIRCSSEGNYGPLERMVRPRVR